MSLDTRARTILQLVVESYIGNAEPVSSATVSQRGKALKLSPATIRSAMAELEQQGLLHQPHTSSGRVPTELGLRTYLDGLMSPKLHPWDRSRLDAIAAQTDLADFPANLGQSLAGLSGQVAVVALPRFFSSRVHEVGLVRVQAGRFLAYFISAGGLVQHKVVEVEFDLTSDEVVWVQNFLNDRLKDKSLSDVRQSVRHELQHAEALRDSLRRHACELCERALPEGDMRVVVEGATHLVDQPEFADVDKLRQVLRALDDKTALLKLLDRILDSSGVRVVLGSEHQLREVPELACVGSRWTSPSGHSGSVSLIGPTRMDYGRLVPLVRYAMQLLEGYCQRI
jgi:heat-inducible transcriptional repressor